MSANEKHGGACEQGTFGAMILLTSKVPLKYPQGSAIAARTVVAFRGDDTLIVCGASMNSCTERVSLPVKEY